MSDRQAVSELDQKCPYCGRANGAEAIRCFECGTKLPEPVIEKTTPRAPVQPIKTAINASEQKCSYCGRSNSVDVTHCSECGTILAEPVIEETISTEHAQPVTTDSQETETKWVARDAWKFIGMFVGFEFVIGIVRGALGVLWPHFRVWSHSGAGYFSFTTLYFAVYLLNMFYFAKVETLNDFFRLFGLERSPSSSIWFAIVATLTIRAIGHVIIASGLSPSPTSQWIAGMRTSGPERYFYLAPALITAPLVEELFMRGFLYRAFRGSYSVRVSTAWILIFTAFTHHQQYISSWAAALVLSAITILQCTLRERTGNLLDCIVIHFVFNVTGSFARNIFR